MPEQVWFVLLLASASLAAILLLSALRLDIDAQAFGEPNGSWGLAFGFDVGPVALAGVLASGTPPRFELLTLGRRFSLPSAGSSQPEKHRGSSAFAAGASQRLRGLWRSISLSQAIELLFSKRQRLAVDELTVNVAYDFRDIVLTGKLTGALCVFSGALPGRIKLTQRPGWDGAERFEVAIHGTLRLWLGRVLVELIWCMLRGRWRFAAASDPGPASRERPEVSR